MRDLLTFGLLVGIGVAVVAGVTLAPGPGESGQCRRMSPGSIAAITGCPVASARAHAPEAPQAVATARAALVVARVDPAR